MRLLVLMVRGPPSTTCRLSLRASSLCCRVDQGKGVGGGVPGAPRRMFTHDSGISAMFGWQSMAGCGLCMARTGGGPRIHRKVKPAEQAACRKLETRQTPSCPQQGNVADPSRAHLAKFENGPLNVSSSSRTLRMSSSRSAMRSSPLVR